MGMATTETFAGGQQTGWTDTNGNAAPVDTTPNDGFSDFLGRFVGSGGVEAVSKTYTFTASSSPTTISFDFNKIDSWDEGYFGVNDQFKVFLNGQTALTFAPSGFSGDDDAPGGSNGASGNFTAGSDRELHDYVEQSGQRTRFRPADRLLSAGLL